MRLQNLFLGTVPPPEHHLVRPAVSRLTANIPFQPISKPKLVRMARLKISTKVLALEVPRRRSEGQPLGLVSVDPTSDVRRIRNSDRLIGIQR